MKTTYKFALHSNRLEVIFLAVASSYDVSGGTQGYNSVQHSLSLELNHNRLHSLSCNIYRNNVFYIFVHLREWCHDTEWWYIIYHELLEF